MSHDKKTTFACIQHLMTEHKEENWQRSADLIQQAANAGADCIVLPELHGTPYFCNQEKIGNFALAETIPGPTTQFFANLAKKIQTVIVISVFEKRMVGVYHNTAVVLEKNGEIAGCYRKMHIPDDPGYGEKYYFTPGDLGFAPIDTSVGKLGVLVCWDQWFPEAARLMALRGADCLIYPTAIGWDPTDTKAEQQRQQDAWFTIQRSHAIANHLPVIISNRVGKEGDNHFWGGSAIIGQQGEVLQQLTPETDSLAIAEINAERTQTLRQIWPYFRDRRIDAYDGLLLRVDDRQ